ncbi:MAG: hypothetical protein KAT62_05570 [Desulfuromonadales bacterium]|nr:hypothetical protein [Desulfuromonadales bacterium]
MEINTNKWLQFFEPFFPTPGEARTFVEELEPLCIDDTPHPAKIMMHQTQRLISLADDIPEIRRNNETLPLLFLLICAEHIAKKFHNFNKDGQSRAYVRRFFNEFLSEEDKRKIETGIRKHDRKPSTVQQATDILYDVRCDTVHEGKYWGFHFHDGDTPILGTDPDVIISIKLSELRNIIVRGCIEAIKSYELPQ